MNIKPIETVYNGYRFRSRLEARWAVFFDAAGIKYEYEPEGFILSDGTKYLPDFYLPDDDIYVEVKQIRQGFEDEIAKAIRVITKKNKIILVLTEIPYNEICNVWWFPVFYYNPVFGYIDGCRITFSAYEDDDDITRLHFVRDWAVGARCRLNAGYLCVEKFRKIYDNDLKDFCPINDTELANDEFPPRDVLEDEFLDNCYIKARQARFEHGEKPNVRGVSI